MFNLTKKIRDNTVNELSENLKNFINNMEESFE
jgi:hypothetical protein